MADMEERANVPAKQASGPELENPRLMNGFAPLARLPQVAVKSPDMASLSRIGEIVRDLPLALRENGHYQLELVGNELHLREETRGIDSYQFWAVGGLVQSLSAPKRTELRLPTQEGELTIFLYQEPCESAPKSTPSARRTTAPYRRTEAPTASYLTSSESAKHRRSGEG